MENFIKIKGAREHNLKNINIDIPRNKFVVVTGLSGSGKSSLAFDTIYAEGQRRYVESLSSYARQFLEQMQKPSLDYIEGLSPTISIEQRSASSNPRSTVGTQTEIYDYLRLLFARIGKVHCYSCGRLIQRQSSQQIVQQLLDLGNKVTVEIFSPLIRGRKGEYAEAVSQVRKQGFVKVRVDGKIYNVDEKIKLERYKIHNIDIFVDKLEISPEVRKRLTDSVETALNAGKGIIYVKVSKKNIKVRELIFNEQYSCSHCNISYSEVAPRVFSFNSPFGACPSCGGLGTKMEFDVDLIVPDRTKSIKEGAIAPWKRGGKGYMMYYRAVIKELAYERDFSLEASFNKLPKSIQKILFYGSDDVIWGKEFEGVIPHLTRLFKTTDSDYLKEEISRFMSSAPCPECQGARLKKESLAVRINSKNLHEVVQLSIKDAKDFFTNLKLNQEERMIAHEVLKEIIQRLEFCLDVGLGYLSLDRKSATLSGGEAQRIRLATQVGSGLVGVIYVLDEPSIGLHQRDNNKLINTLHHLRDLGNTLIVVEHDEETIRLADHVVDLGLGAGRHGGKLIFSGTLKQLFKCKKSLTAKYLKGDLKIEVPKKRRQYQHSKLLEIKGAREHNLKDIDVPFPLGNFICVSGVSGSGKSTLVDDVLFRALSRIIYKSKERAGEHKKIEGVDNIDKVIVVDQQPIGRTPRSNPATYTKVFTHIRDIFEKLPESRMRGYKKGRFSFNVKGGRCEACQGDGIKKIEMHFLPDVYVNCSVCKGRRFNEATLEVKYKGKSIADVLEMPVEEAYNLFENVPKIRNILKTLLDVGLGYIQLGQSATTLSGGEAQRVKLSSQLAKRATGKTLYILDEPTTGLHFADTKRLINVLQRLVDTGNTVIVIEHNLDVLKSADYLIDLGPEGGDEGGKIVAKGSPEEISRNRKSFTGKYLKKALKA